ncbi:hypothetical protein CHU98_g11233 [Xylaria longipes]|nr:hypothetical protein CHU98_g11233 [Xylaria longipes]
MCDRVLTRVLCSRPPSTLGTCYSLLRQQRIFENNHYTADLEFFAANCRIQTPRRHVSYNAHTYIQSRLLLTTPTSSPVAAFFISSAPITSLTPSLATRPQYPSATGNTVVPHTRTLIQVLQVCVPQQWNVLNRQRKQEKDMDLDGIVYNDELEDIPESMFEAQEETDDMMVDAIAREEEAELDAMLSLLDTSSLQTPRRPDTPSLSDDEDYDTLFMDMLSQQSIHCDHFTSSGQMDLS